MSTNTLQEKALPSMAMLFTDALGQVVFVDQTFLRLLNYQDAGAVAGEPLHKALGLDQKSVKKLLEDVRTAGHIQDRMIEVQSSQGIPVNVAFAGVATFDDNGTFLGADLTLRNLKRATTEIKMVEHGDTIKARVQQLMEEDAPVKEIDYVQVYFKTQIGAIYVLLVRLMGIWVQNQLDDLLNKKAAEKGWNVSFHNGLFTDEGLTAPAECQMYCDLMNTAASHAINLIGKRVVVREMETVDQYMDAHALEAAVSGGVKLAL